ncbi:MAG: hypothetical protein K9L61_06325 [Candidatus Omnitrophica bacterium]|nr:hypothetical protein [Candidatus Omnitrophota bacterium]
MRFVILLCFIFLPFSALAAERLEGFVYEDGTTGGHQVDLEETGYISRIEAEGVESFVIFKIDSQTRVKEPVLKITDFSEARGRELAPGEYQLVPELAGGVPEDEVLEPGLSGQEESGALKAKISLEILSADEAESEGLR